MRIVNLLDRQGQQISPKTHISSVFSTDGVSLGSKLTPTADGVNVTGTVTATQFSGSLSKTLTITSGENTYTFNGTEDVTATIEGGASDQYVLKAGDTMTGNLYAPGFYVSSSRDIKENIRFADIDYKGIIMDTQVYQYNYKNDKNKTPKVGIIAEESPDMITTPEKDGMDTGNVLGLLLLSIQRLFLEVDILKSQMGLQ